MEPVLNRSDMIALKACSASDIQYGGDYAASIVFFTLNIVAIGLYQSLGRAREATAFMLLRGFVFILLAFLLLPHSIGDLGLWLAIPVSEAATFIVIAAHHGLHLRK